MENKAIAPTGNNQALDEQRALMNQALERLGLVRRETSKAKTDARAGRLIVALDLTGSRAESLKQAQKATAAMFTAIKTVGAVAVKLAYYRGCQCKAGAWHDDAEKVTGAMLSLSCVTGNTQIGRVLKLALAEKEKLSGVVFVGDHCEESANELLNLAATLGKRSIPLFIFHEVVDYDTRALDVRPLFQQMAKLSGGVYSEFRPDSSEVMRELLSTVAAFSAAGHEGVKQVAQPVTAAARQLQKQLLMLPPCEGLKERNTHLPTILLTGCLGSNADLIRNVSAFYLQNGMRVADVTFGKGVFWKNVDLTRFELVPSDAQSGVDFCRLPYENASFDVIVLDPPYMHGGDTIKNSINCCYRNKNTSHESVVRLYTGGILEAARVLKKRGQLWIKTQDEIESGRQRLTSHEIRSIAELLGFVTKDLFVLVQSSIPAMREPSQKTARKNHSYLFIFEFRR